MGPHWAAPIAPPITPPIGLLPARSSAYPDECAIDFPEGRRTVPCIGPLPHLDFRLSWADSNGGADRE